MWSDGSISKKGNDISIRLLSKDQDVLKQLSMFFYKKDRVMIHTDGNSKEIATFRMCSQKLKQRLGEIGCHPNKTFTNQYPVGLNPDLDRHFIRGVIDGDGSVLDYDSPLIVIVGTDELLCKISEVVEKQLNIKPYICKAKKHREKDVNISYLSYKGIKKFKQIADWIYSDSTIKMERKYQKYLSGREKESDKFFSAEEEKDIIEQFINGKTFGEISKEYNEHYSNIKKITQRNVPFNYGSTDIITYNDKLLTKEYISSLNIEEKQKIKKYLFNYFRGYGFPYPKHSDFELYSDWKAIKEFDSSVIINGDKLKTKNYTGNKLTKHFFENFYKVSFDKKKTMLEAFENDEMLNKVIDNRLGISYKETFNISGAMLRQGLRNSRLAMSASMFMTTVAKYIYDTYAEQDGIVYDYSSGFGQRLVGALSSKNNLKYVGVEPWTESFNNLNKLSKSLFKDSQCKLYNVGSENFYDKDLDEKICLAFSSPPYFDTEVYCNESTQCNLRSYEDYLNYWNETCKNIFKMLKPNGCFIVNISEKYKYDLEIIALKYFAHEQYLYLSYGLEESSKNEPVIVMRKK
jgi:hypothetical protein